MRLRQMAGPTALATVEMSNAVVDLAYLGKSVAAEQECHIEERKRRISSVPHEIDHCAIVIANLVALVELDIVQRAGERETLRFHDIAGIDTGLRSSLQNGKVLPHQRIPGSRVGYEMDLPAMRAQSPTRQEDLD